MDDHSEEDTNEQCNDDAAIAVNDEVEYYENDDKEDVMNNFLEYSVNQPPDTKSQRAGCRRSPLVAAGPS